MSPDRPREPREFRYWHNRKRLWARALRRSMQLALGFDPQPDDGLARRVADMYYDADPLAEAFVDEVYFGDGAERGRQLLDRAIAAQSVAELDDAPDSLLELFADLDRDPPWVDHQLVERGARVFRGYGTAVFHFAGAITLAGYAESSVAKPLVLTGGYTGDSTRQRFLETAAFWIAVSEPGGMRRGAPGWASAMRVRIMHVFVRRRLLAHPEWRVEDWGVPISQGDALLTLMGGSFAPGLALRAMGFRTSDDDILALLHFWRYVGHVMGVRPSWYPTTMEDGYRLSYLTAVKAAHRSGADGRLLCQSFIEAFDAAGGDIRSRLAAAIHRGYTRFFTPPWIYSAMKMPRVGLWALHPLAQFPVIFAAETARRHSRTADAVLDRAARWQRDSWFQHHMGERKAEYHPPTALTR
ncbi:MAG: DUF2236 domain-containing protein [Deltaproteobacteria bacterium]|nr:DUF2236 domain-containing protein [Deltaproteobacteria bacterium]